MNETFSFQELRESLRASDKGKLVDSLIAVEFGLEFYEASWFAHQDYLAQVAKEAKEYAPESLAEVATLYLLDMAEEIGFSEIDFDTVEQSAQ